MASEHQSVSGTVSISVAPAPAQTSMISFIFGKYNSIGPFITSDSFDAKVKNNMTLNQIIDKLRRISSKMQSESHEFTNCNGDVLLGNETVIDLPIGHNGVAIIFYCRL